MYRRLRPFGAVNFNPTTVVKMEEKK